MSIEEFWFLLELLVFDFPLEAPAEVPGAEWRSLGRSGEPPPGISAQRRAQAVIATARTGSRDSQW